MDTPDCCHYDCCDNSNPYGAGCCPSSPRPGGSFAFSPRPRPPSLRTIREKQAAGRDVRTVEDYEALDPLIKTRHKVRRTPIRLPFFESRMWGCILVAVSALSYGTSASLVSLEKDIPTPLVVMARFTGAFILTAGSCIFQQVPVFTAMMNGPLRDKALIFVRSCFGLVSFTCGTYAFQNMPVGEATIIVSMAPLFVAMLSVCFLGERVSVVPVILTLLSLTGVFLLVDPLQIGSKGTTSNSRYYAAAGAALAQAMSKAVVYIYLRKTNNRINFMVVVFWYTLMGTTSVVMVTALLYYFLAYAGRDTTWVARGLDPRDYGILGGISCLGFVSQITLTRAAQLINTTLCSLIRNGDIIVTFLFQLLYLHVLPCWLQVVGIIVVMVTTLAMIIYKDAENNGTNTR